MHTKIALYEKKSRSVLKFIVLIQALKFGDKHGQK